MQLQYLKVQSACFKAIIIIKTVTYNVVSVKVTANWHTGYYTTEQSLLFIYTTFIYYQGTFFDIFMQDIIFYHLLLCTFIHTHIYTHSYYNNEFYFPFTKMLCDLKRGFI